VPADRVTLVAETEFAAALQDEEHLLLAMVTVKRALRLAGRQHSQVVAELLGADVWADRAAAGSEIAVVLHIVEIHLVEVHQGLGHGHSSHDG
jgi:hypothetical protein